MIYRRWDGPEMSWYEPPDDDEFLPKDANKKLHDDDDDDREDWPPTDEQLDYDAARWENLTEDWRDEMQAEMDRAAK